MQRRDCKIRNEKGVRRRVSHRGRIENRGKGSREWCDEYTDVSVLSFQFRPL